MNNESEANPNDHGDKRDFIEMIVDEFKELREQIKTLAQRVDDLEKKMGR